MGTSPAQLRFSKPCSSAHQRTLLETVLCWVGEKPTDGGKSGANPCQQKSAAVPIRNAEWSSRLGEAIRFSTQRSAGATPTWSGSSALIESCDAPKENRPRKTFYFSLPVAFSRRDGFAGHESGDCDSAETRNDDSRPAGILFFGRARQPGRKPRLADSLLATERWSRSVRPPEYKLCSRAPKIRVAKSGLRNVRFGGDNSIDFASPGRPRFFFGHGRPATMSDRKKSGRKSGCLRPLFLTPDQWWSMKQPRPTDRNDQPRCVHCGCTQERPCKLGRYARCSSMISEGDRRVCSNRDCVQAEIDYLFEQLNLRERKIA